MTAYFDFIESMFSNVLNNIFDFFFLSFLPCFHSVIELMIYEWMAQVTRIYKVLVQAISDSDCHILSPIKKTCLQIQC